MLIRRVVPMVLFLAANGCSGDGEKTDSGSSTTDNCGFAPCETSVTETDSTTSPTSGSTGSTGSGATDGTGTTGQIAPCSTHRDEASCVAGNPGEGQVCGWVAAWPTTVSGTPPTCTYGDPTHVCVQQLGDTGGTPFGSCGGDGTPPVYWRDDGNAGVELLGSDGFFTPDGWSACDCHDGSNDPADPPECCCACQGGWPPG